MFVWSVRKIKLPIDIAHEQLVDFCQRWKIRELALFGSILRSEFSPTSNVDILVTFGEDASWSLVDSCPNATLEAIFKRKVDVLTRRAVEQKPKPDPA